MNYILLSGYTIDTFYLSIHQWIDISVVSVCAKSLQSCPTLCPSTGCSLPGTSVHGILQAGTLEWVAVPFSRDLQDPGIELKSLASPALAGGQLFPPFGYCE